MVVIVHFEIINRLPLAHILLHESNEKKAFERNPLGVVSFVLYYINVIDSDPENLFLDSEKTVYTLTNAFLLGS